MVAVAPTVTDVGPIRIATWVGLDGGDTGDPVLVAGYNRIILVSACTFADSDSTEVRGHATDISEGVAAGTAGDWQDQYGQAISIAAADEVHVLKQTNLDYVSLDTTVGGIAGPSAMTIVLFALRTQDY